MYKLVPYIRRRFEGQNRCDCKLSGKCLCAWSPVRAAFDNVAAVDDGCIGPNQVRDLLMTLRSPAPVARDELTECLTHLADGDEKGVEPRIKAVDFVEWYKSFFDENDVEETASAAGSGK
jgi:hypothetical protein